MPFTPRFLLFVASSSLLLAGCAHEITVEERLDNATADIAPAKPLPSSRELGNIRCTDTEAELAKARNTDRSENDRLQTYSDLYSNLKSKAQMLQEALSRNPDLSYENDAEKIRANRDLCAQQSTDVRIEFDRDVRDLVDNPFTQDVRGGRQISIARVSFTTLRKAILILDPEDREVMMAKVSSAEKRVESKSASPRR